MYTIKLSVLYQYQLYKIKNKCMKINIFFSDAANHILHKRLLLDFGKGR